MMPLSWRQLARFGGKGGSLGPCAQSLAWARWGLLAAFVLGSGVAAAERDCEINDSRLRKGISAYRQAQEQIKADKPQAASQAIDQAVDILGEEARRIEFDATCYQLQPGAHGPRRVPRQVEKDLAYEPVSLGSRIRGRIPPRAMVAVEHLRERRDGEWGKTTEEVRIQVSNGSRALPGSPAIVGLRDVTIQVEGVGAIQVGDVPPGESRSVAKSVSEEPISGRLRFAVKERYGLVPQGNSQGGS